LASSNVRVLGSCDPVDETYGQIEAVRIPDERRQLAGDGALGGGLLERRGCDPSLGERDRVVDERREVVGSRGRDLTRRISHRRVQISSR
jgi:hypothetical protein